MKKLIIVMVSLILASTSLAGIDNMKISRNESATKTKVVEKKMESKPLYDRRYEDWKRNESLQKASSAGSDRYIIRDDKRMR